MRGGMRNPRSEEKKSGGEAFLRNSPQMGRNRTPIQRKEHNTYGRRPETKVVRNNGTPPCVTWASRHAREASHRVAHENNTSGGRRRRHAFQPEDGSNVAGPRVSTYFGKKQRSRRPRAGRRAHPHSLKNSPPYSRMWGHWCQHSTTRHRDQSDDSGRSTWAVRDLC